MQGLRVGVPERVFRRGTRCGSASLGRSGNREAAQAGCEILPISLPHTEYAIPSYYIIATAEASSNLARFDGVRYGIRAARGARRWRKCTGAARDEGFGAEVKRRIMLGTYVLSAGYYDAYYLKAQKVRRLLARDFDQAFAQVDAIVTPDDATPAFKLGEKMDDPVSMYLADIYTVTADLVGVPGISIPCGKSKEGLPIGLQILRKAFRRAHGVTRGAGGRTCLGGKAGRITGPFCRRPNRRFFDFTSDPPVTLLCDEGHWPLVRRFLESFVEIVTTVSVSIRE